MLSQQECTNPKQHKRSGSVELHDSSCKTALVHMLKQHTPLPTHIPNKIIPSYYRIGSACNWRNNLYFEGSLTDRFHHGNPALSINMVTSMLFLFLVPQSKLIFQKPAKEVQHLNTQKNSWQDTNSSHKQIVH